jgi:hypothetical protein
MKYSEFLQFRELLEQSGVTLEEFKKDPTLYEGILGKIGSGLWKLAKKGMQQAVSVGLSANHKEKLNKKAEEIKKWIINEIEKAETTADHPLYTTFEKRKLAIEKKDKRSLAVFDKHISQYIRKNVDILTKRVERNINKNNNITDDDKDKLNDYWEQLIIQIEISTVMALQDKNIISEDTADDYIKVMAKYIKLGQTPVKKEFKNNEK